jgi:hypothetical protein
MAERAFKCPQCNGPLSPSRFAKSVVCSYCGATVTIDPTTVSAAGFRRAFAEWNAPATHGITTWLALGESRWSPGGLVAHGEISDVYAAQRARWPTEGALLKVLRDERDRALFDHEWEVLEALREATPDGAAGMLSRIPEPIVHGRVTEGLYAGASVAVLRATPGFRYTLEDFHRARPSGIDPRASIWVWRRVLEILAFLHKQGFGHGAVRPCHLLVEENEHGIRMVGFSAAGRTVRPAADVGMSARTMIAVLGGDAAAGALPAAVPGPLAALLRETAAADPEGGGVPDAWSLRERLGSLAREVFGPPKFCPLVMPR